MRRHQRPGRARGNPARRRRRWWRSRRRRCGRPGCAADAGLIEHARQHLARLVVHVAERTRQRHRIGLAVAGARIGEHAVAGALGKLAREIAPHRDTAEALVQQHQLGAASGPGPHHAASTRRPSSRGSSRAAALSAALTAPPCRVAAPPRTAARSLKRWILPVAFNKVLF